MTSRHEQVNPRQLAEDYLTRRQAAKRDIYGWLWKADPGEPKIEMFVPIGAPDKLYPDTIHGARVILRHVRAPRLQAS